MGALDLALKFGGKVQPQAKAPAPNALSLAMQYGAKVEQAPKPDPKEAGPEGYVANALDALSKMPAGMVKGIWDEVLAPSGRKLNEGIATLRTGDAPLLGAAQLLASVPGAEYVAGLSGKASQALAEARQGNGSAAVVNASQAVPGVQSGMAMQSRFVDRAREQALRVDPNARGMNPVFSEGPIATNALGELHGNIAGYALLDKAPGAIKDASGVVAPKVGNALKESAAKSYERALGATTKDNKRLASQVVPELVDRGVIAPTRKSLYEKMNASAENTKINLDEALAKVPDDLKVDLTKADARLEGLKDQHLVKAQDGSLVPANDAAAASIDSISRLQADLRNLDPSFGSVRKFRQILDKQITAGNKSFGRTINEGSVLDVTREGANAIRSVLAEAEPSIAALNKELSFWLKAKDVLGATIQRTASQANPLGKTILEGAVTAGELGQGAGIVSAVGTGKLLGMAKSIFDSTGWRTASATLKGKLANAMIDGDAKAVSYIGSSLGAKPNIAPIPPSKLPPVLPDPVIADVVPKKTPPVSAAKTPAAAVPAEDSLLFDLKRSVENVKAREAAPTPKTNAQTLADQVLNRVVSMKKQGMSNGQMKASVLQDILKRGDGYKPADVQRMVDLILKETK